MTSLAGCLLAQVTLTGERDALLSQLDTLKMDLKRELNAQADASAGLERKGSIAAYKRRR